MATADYLLDSLASAHRSLARDFLAFCEMAGQNSMHTRHLKYIGPWLHFMAQVQNGWPIWDSKIGILSKPTRVILAGTSVLLIAWSGLPFSFDIIWIIHTGLTLRRFITATRSIAKSWIKDTALTHISLPWSFIRITRGEGEKIKYPLLDQDIYNTYLVKYIIFHTA